MYSFSKIDKFKFCKKEYHYRYILRLKQNPKKFFEKGSYFHYILEHYPGPYPKFEFKLSKKADIQEYQKLFKSIFNDDIKSYLKEENVREIRFELDEIPLMGYIDYLAELKESILTIIDWKSGKVYENKTSEQLSLYALWVFLNPLFNHIDTVDCFYYYIEHDVKKRHTFTRKEAESLKNKLLDDINKIEQETKYPRTVTKNCSWCDHFKECQPYNMNNLKGD